MKQLEIKKLSAGVTLVVAILLLALGILLLVLDPEVSAGLSIIFAIIFIIINAISEITASFKDGNKKEALVKIAIYALLIAFILIFSMVFLTAINIIFAIVAFILVIIRVMICIHLARYGGKHIIRNAVAGLICLAFGIIMLVLPPGYKVAFVVGIVGIFLILYSFNFFGDFFAAVLKRDMKEDRTSRRVHISLPNLFTAGTVSDAVTECAKLKKEHPDECTFVMSPKDYDPSKINFEVLVHVNQEYKSMGHIDVCIDDTVYAYGDYDVKTKILGGLYGGGTFFHSPKRPYINNSIKTKNKYIIGYGCELSDSQLKAVKDRIKEMIDCSKEFTLEDAARENRDDSDYLVVLLKLGGQPYLVNESVYKRYFGLATNCVDFANVLMGKAGFEDLSQGSLKTPGAYINLLEGMLYRSNTRVIQKTAYVRADD